MAKKPPVKLTDKQGAFALRYVVHFNATRAAVEAGFAEKHAASQGYQLLQNPLVRAEVERLQKEQADRLKIDSDELLRGLVGDLRADIADIVTPEGSLRPIDEWPMAFRTGLVAGFEIEEVYDKEEQEEPEFEPEAQPHGGWLKRERQARRATGRIAKIKLTDRTRIKELVGRHQTVQAWKDRKVHEAGDSLKELYAQIAGKAVGPQGGAG